jgi:hypothetical protein
MKLPLKHYPYPGECPYCLKNVGYIGRLLAGLFGTGLHGCDFSNVAEPDALKAEGSDK